MPSGELEFNLKEPNGNYDYLEIRVELLSTDSKDYFVDKSQVTNCNVGSRKTFKLFRNESAKSLTVNDLCMLSNYNVSARTALAGYDTVEYSTQFKTCVYSSFFSLF